MTVSEQTASASGRNTAANASASPTEGSGDALAVELVTPAHRVWSGAAHYVAAPTVSGPVGIFPKHEPILAIIGQGTVKIETAAGETTYAEVEGGFLSVDCDQITIVTDTATVVDAPGSEPAAAHNAAGGGHNAD